jgi:hypothetical protein
VWSYLQCCELIEAEGGREELWVRVCLPLNDGCAMGTFVALGWVEQHVLLDLAQLVLEEFKRELRSDFASFCQKVVEKRNA